MIRVPADVYRKQVPVASSGLLKFRPVALILLILFLLPISARGQPAGLPTNSVGLSGNREVPLTIKIVFMGISASEINQSYLISAINTPLEKSQTILAGPLNNGVTFKFTYEIGFADSATIADLNSTLTSMEKMEITYPASGSPTGLVNPYFDNSTTRISTVVNSFYDADQVESWLKSSALFATPPVPGYTLFVADLHNYLPSMTYPQYLNYTTKCRVYTSGPDAGKCNTTNNGTITAHYYNRTVVEPDLGFKETRHYMTGWGGNSRFQFLDLSAGPSYWTNELPLQVAAGARNVDLSSTYGVNWGTQFVADYLFGAVYNLFAPDQIYPVNYSAKYNFDLFIFDVRNSSETIPSLTAAVNETMIRGELASLLPYANVSVTPNYLNIADYPGLGSVIASATTKITDLAINGSIVDARLVYNWLSTSGEGHISEFINVTRTSNELDIPAFIFAFTGRYNFGFTFKEDVFLVRDRDSIYGVALGDLVLISHGQYDLRAGDSVIDGPLQPNKGIGFTRTIIHELGHMLGLAHPFSYDLTEDFVDSVMGYYANSLTYSQFDRDVILRGVNDELLIFAGVTLANTTSNLLNSGQMAAARRAIQVADQKYSKMDYAGAVADSLSAALNAFAAHQLQGGGFFSLFSPLVTFTLVGLVVGAAVGFLAGYLVFKRRTVGGVRYNRCPTCQQPLRWDPAMMRWYCDTCQKPV